MTFLLVVEKSGIAVVTRRYATASMCCEAILKAENYYKGLNEKVKLIMNTEQGYLITYLET
jgi:hypothetical protein